MNQPDDSSPAVSVAVAVRIQPFGSFASEVIIEVEPDLGEEAEVDRFAQVLEPITVVDEHVLGPAAEALDKRAYVEVLQ